MIHAWASNIPIEEVSSGSSSIQKPPWRVGDTADGMFSIDSSL